MVSPSLLLQCVPYREKNREAHLAAAVPPALLSDSSFRRMPVSVMVAAVFIISWVDLQIQSVGGFVLIAFPVV